MRPSPQSVRASQSFTVQAGKECLANSRRLVHVPSLRSSTDSYTVSNDDCAFRRKGTRVCRESLVPTGATPSHVRFYDKRARSRLCFNFRSHRVGDGVE